MKLCLNCGCQMADDARYCPVCGSAAPTTTEPPFPIPGAAYSDPYDHTEDFCAEDIAENKLVCMLIYLLDFVGVMIALLAAKESDYVRFHIRQSMKFTVIEVLLILISLLLCWTFIVPIVGIVAAIILLVIKFISFTQVCGGKAKEPSVIRSIGFLK